MAQEELRNRRKILKLAAVFPTLAMFSAHAETHRRLIGMTFVLNSIASDIEIRRITFQGGKNEREARIFVSKASPRELSYMPGDLAGFPDWMDVEWYYGLSDAPNVSNEQARAAASTAQARFNLAAMIPQSAIEEVRRDRERKQLKLIFTFNDDKLDVRYEVYQWRR